MSKERRCGLRDPGVKVLGVWDSGFRDPLRVFRFWVWGFGVIVLRISEPCLGICRFEVRGLRFMAWGLVFAV